MKAGYRFDRTARTERYFVDTLFAHFLLANNFSGLCSLFAYVFGAEVCNSLPEDFEIVSELDPLRDGSVGNDRVKELYRTFKRVAVPDLFLRWSTLCLVIEGKFFTDPAIEELQEQVRLQRDAIAKVKSFTIYKDYQFKFAVLTPTSVKFSPSSDITVLSWDNILNLMENEANNKDIIYVKEVIRHALNRVIKERTIPITFEKMKFQDILSRLPQLIESEKIFIGFTGGTATLAVATELELIGRSHYKVSDIRWSDNWITLDQFLRRIFELRGHLDKYDDQNE